MKRRDFLGVMLATGLSSGISLRAETAAHPNIVYILADDMGYGDVSCFNPNGKIPTPNIDSIAQAGIKFVDAHTNSSVCTPTRYGILTGRYCWRTSKTRGVLNGHSDHLIDPNRETVASFLKKHGYATACVGKWHLGMDWPTTDGKRPQRTNPDNIDFERPIKNGPLDVGFDYYFGISGSLNMDPHAFIEGRKVVGNMNHIPTADLLKKRGIKGKPGWVSDAYKQAQVLPRFTEKASNWIKQKANSKNPFFLYMPLNSPHSPIVPTEQFKGKSGLNEHADFCMQTDWSVGQILKTLAEAGVADNTLVIFTSDNGTSPMAHFAELQEKGHYPSSIYRGMKGTLWEGGHRVPFVASWPGKIAPGTSSDQLICTTDMLATCADIVATELPDDAGEDSLSFLPALQGENILGNSSRGVVHHSDAGIFSIRRGKWKLIFDNKGGSRRHNPKDGAVKNSSEYLLFDMESDPEESSNLIAQHPELAEELKKLLASYVNRGRSTPGAAQENTKSSWRQIEVVEEFLN